jgi:hypothetical protein
MFYIPDALSYEVRLFLIFNVNQMMNNLIVDNGPDYFAVLSHPEVFKEIKVIARQLSEVPGSFKPEILNSFLKDHSINIDWLIGNDELVQMITSGPLKMYHTERLFESRRSNKLFIEDLEGYIQTELVNCESDAKHKNVLSAPSYVGSLEDQSYHPCESTAAGTQEPSVSMKKK